MDIGIEVGNRRETGLGMATQVRIEADPPRRLGWEEVYEVFAGKFPGKWAVEVYPPREQLVNTTHAYHLYVLDEPPRGMNLRAHG